VIVEVVTHSVFLDIFVGDVEVPVGSPTRHKANYDGLFQPPQEPGGRWTVFDTRCRFPTPMMLLVR